MVSIDHFVLARGSLRRSDAESLVGKFCSLRGEEASVMVLVAILIVAIFSFGALAMDTAAIAASQQEASHFAKYSALNALDAYTRTEGEHEIRMAAALEAANSIGGLNVTLLRPESGNMQDLSDQDFTGDPQLVPGRFYSEAPTNCSAEQVCGPGKDTPCFVKLADVNIQCDTAEAIGPNAFQVIGEYATGIRRIFSAVLSNSAVSIRVDEVAALVPRHGCFIVDISPSMYGETHSATRPAPFAALGAYQLSADQTQFQNANTFHDAVWASMDASRAAPTTLPLTETSDSKYVTRHYQSDYTKVEILKDDDYFPGNYDEHHPNPFQETSVTDPAKGGTIELSHARSNQVVFYRTDTFRDSFYTGPEPISTVFDGVARALAIYKQRAVTGDKACIIFLDAVLIWPRVFNLTSDFDYLLKHLDLRTPDLMRGPDKVSLAQLGSMAILPGHTAPTDLRLGILEAYRQFQKARTGEIPSVDFIVYAGDGLSNCTTCNAAVDPTCFPAGCGDTYYHYRESMREIHDIGAEVLYPSKISFSAILAGGHVGPNTLNVAAPENPTTCLTDEEARLKEIDFVSGGDCGTDAECAASYLAMSDALPFTRVNADIYKLTRMTGGVFAPLRKQDTGQACTPTCSANSPTVQTTSCKTPGAQIDEYIEKIMGSNPFMIVPH